MKNFLEGLLPRILPPEQGVVLIPHEGKRDLEVSIPRKLRAWRDPEARFVIVRDQDSADCKVVKQRLLGLCAEAKREALVRIACRELEAWYVGDLAAVDRAFGTNLAVNQSKTKFRDPDRIGSPSHELASLVPGFGKVSAARKLGPLLDIENTRSTSFRCFVRALRKLAHSEPP